MNIYTFMSFDLIFELPVKFLQAFALHQVPIGQIFNCSFGTIQIKNMRHMLENQCLKTRVICLKNTCPLFKRRKNSISCR